MFIAFLLVFSNAVCRWPHTTEEKVGQEIRFQYGGWESQVANNYIFYIFLRDYLNLNATFWPVSGTDEWNAVTNYPQSFHEWLANNELDISMEVWAVNTAYIDGLENRIANLGSNGMFTRLSWYVPKYLVDVYPFITSSPERLRELEPIFRESSGKFEILAAIEEWYLTQQSYDLIETFYLNATINVLGSESALSEKIRMMISEHNYFIVAHYEPHIDFESFGHILVPIEIDCKYITKMDCFYPMEGTTYKYVSRRINDTMPLILKYAQNFQITNQQVYEIILGMRVFGDWEIPVCRMLKDETDLLSQILHGGYNEETPIQNTVTNVIVDAEDVEDLNESGGSDESSLDILLLIIVGGAALLVCFGFLIFNQFKSQNLMMREILEMKSNPNYIAAPAAAAPVPNPQNPQRGAKRTRFLTDGQIMELEENVNCEEVSSEDRHSSVLPNNNRAQYYNEGMYYGTKNQITGKESDYLYLQKQAKNESDLPPELLKFVIKKKDLKMNNGDVIGEGIGGQVFTAKYNMAQCCVKMVLDVETYLSEGGLFFEVSTHPNICRLFGFFQDINPIHGQSYYLVLEYFRDKSVLQALKSGVTFDRQQKHFICKQIFCGLLHLHRKHVIHGDLALRNVLIDLSQFRVAITDFGLSRRDTIKTPARTISPRWASPELCKTLIPTKATDVYAFGITSIELMKDGKVPFSDIPGTSFMRKNIAGEVKPRMYKSWDAPFKRILSACFLPVEKRYSMDQMSGWWDSVDCNIQVAQNHIQRGFSPGVSGNNNNMPMYADCYMNNDITLFE